MGERRLMAGACGGRLALQAASILMGLVTETDSRGLVEARDDAAVAGAEVDADAFSDAAVISKLWFIVARSIPSICRRAAKKARRAMK